MKMEKIMRLVTGAGALLLTMAFLLIPFFPADAAGPRIAAGGLHTVGLQPNGTVVAVGDNSDGQTNVASWSDIVAIANGESHTIGLKSDGTVVAVGLNANNQTDVGSMSGIIAIAGGGYHTIGLKSDHTVMALGNNSFGQTVFDGSWSGIVAVAGGLYTTVGLKSDGKVVAVGDNTHGQTNVGSWTDIVAVASRYIHTVGLKSDGTVVAVGNNVYGQTNVGSWTDIVAVAAGYYHTVGLKSDGTVVAAGALTNDYGQTNVGSWTDIVAVSAGWYHTVGLKSDGTVVAAGALAPYDYGQIDVGAFFLEADNNLKGAKGTQLTLNGSGFGTRRGTVTVGGLPARVTTWFDSAIILQVNASLLPDIFPYPIEVNPGTKGAAPIAYGKSFIMKYPELHTIRANQGAAGSVVVLSGKYFGSKKGTVQLGSTFCPVKYWYMNPTDGSSMAVFTIPKTLTPGHHKVTLFGEAGSATFPSAAFTVKAAGSGNAHADHGSESYDPPDELD